MHINARAVFKIFGLSLVFTFHFFSNQNLLAQDPAIVPPADGYETARSVGMGLGARANAMSTSALQLNPANLAVIKSYHIETAIGYEPVSNRVYLQSALVDGYSGPIAAGISYRYLFGNGRDGHTGMEGKLGVGVALGSSFALGLAGRYMSYWKVGGGEGNQPRSEGFTMDASFQLMPFKGFYLAGFGQNLIDLGSYLTPRLVGGSASYSFGETLTLAFDGQADLSTFKDEQGNIKPKAMFGGAIEFFTGEVPLRVGYAADLGRNTHTITSGVGYTNKSLSVELSYRQTVVGSSDAWIMLSFRYFVF